MARTKAKPEWFTHRTVATLLDVDTETLRDWVEKGEFPRPITTVSQTLFYRAEVINHYLRNGTWPPGTDFNPQRGTPQDRNLP